MKRAAALIGILCAVALTVSCSGTIRKVKTSLVTVTVGSSRTATIDIRPATLTEKTKRFLARTFSLPAAHAAIPTIVQNLRLTVSAGDMTTITATVNVTGLTTADFVVEVPNGPQRHFVVEGLDSGLTAQYTGEAYSDLIGDPVLLTINMAGVNTTDTTAPVFAGLAVISNVTPTSMTLSWAVAADNVTSSADMVYYIYKATAAGGEDFSAPNYSTPPGATSFTVPGLSPATTYYFVVRAKDEAGNIDGNTIEKSNMLSDAVPPTFAGLALVTNVSITSMQLSWPAATDDVTPQASIVYLIYQATTTGGENYAAPAFTTAPGATSYTVIGLTPGTTYYFVVRAADAAGNSDTNTLEKSNTYPGLYVDVLNGDDNTGDGTRAAPFKTITHALSMPNGNEGLFVAAGTYNVISAESFPLQLKPGTALACVGSDHSTVIEASSSVVAIYGDTGALIDNCTILPGSEMTAIDDNATPITVNNVVIDVGAAVNLSADSTIMNSTFLETYSAFITVNSGNPIIKNNTLSGTSNSPDGIVVKAGNPTIQGNTITGMGFSGGSAISIITGTATIDSNTISWGISSGSAGITISGGSPVITKNTITNNNWGIYLLDGNPTITNNSINGNNPYGIYIQTSTTINPVIQANTINCNYFYNLYSSATTTIDVSNNAWENAPPIVLDSLSCIVGTDICYDYLGTVPIYQPYNAAVPDVCIRIPI